MSYDFSTLSPHDFELLTQDLLQRDLNVKLEGFKSGRDGGIDLRCSRGKESGLVVQCKHYVKGVPPDKLQSALTWANAERPDVLVFVVSNFLSNPAKNYIEDYERNNAPAYRIKIWERKDIERLLSSHPALIRK